MRSVIHDNALYYQGVMYAVTIQIELDMTQSPWACFKQLRQTLNAREILVVFIFSLHWPCFSNQTPRTPHMTNVIM